MILTAVRHEVSSLNKTVVVQELELAMKRAYKVVYEVSVTNIM